MLRDLQDTLTHWRVIHLMGFSTLRSRYARSRFGQAWVTLSNMIFVAVIGIVWSKIWGMNIDEYLPYVGVGYVFFLFLSHSVSESCLILVLDARVYMNDRRPFMISIFALVYKNFIILVHNFPLIMLFVVWAGTAKLKSLLCFPLYLLLAVIFLVAAGYTLALICSRFRDMVQIVNLVMQTVFLLTPVVWKIDFVPVPYRDLLIFINPFAAFVELLREPLLNTAVSAPVLLSASCWALGAIILAWATHAVFRREIIFWI